MILEQFYLGCLAQASYFVADETSRVACVVDPRRDVDDYVAFAAARRLRIEHVVLTHVHADFLAGHLELQERTGARIHIGRAAAIEFACDRLADGQSLRLGPEVSLVALETPGHTPESLSLLVLLAERAQPHAVLTGDTLFVGDVGRPDLLEAHGLGPNDLAGQLYDSLHGKLATLPDDTIVYPGHGAGSACGKNIGRETSSTIGIQKRLNWAFAPMPRQQFIDALVSELPSPPGYFAHDALWNRRSRATLDRMLERSMRPLPTGELRNPTLQLLDARSEDRFAAEHVAGSLNIPLDGQYASWAGTLLDAKRPIAVIAEPERSREAVLRLGRIGYDDVLGIVEGGVAAARQAGLATASMSRLSVEELRAWPNTARPWLLDVRTPGERARGSIEASAHIPLSELRARVHEVPADADIVVYCASGYRSMIASSLLEQAGRARVRDLRGGFAAYRR
jgi:glyoxylase-like metal-dependent hydrolase (beta-lactamase superfamily II)/rhodanese-related sulfurtransferase